MQFLISEYEFLLEPYVTRSWRARGLAHSKSYHVSTPIGLRFLCSRTHTTTGMLFWNFNVHFPLVPRKQLFGFTPLSPPTPTSSNPCQDCLLHVQCDLNKTSKIKFWFSIWRYAFTFSIRSKVGKLRTSNILGGETTNIWGLGKYF